jgi:DNA-directed RNA polymerase subunit RPC12/RpoP
MDEMNDTPETTAAAEAASENAGLSQFYGTAKDVVARYTHCALCGANLHFTHVTDFSRNLTQETARCPECGVKARQAMHRLQ